MDRVTISILYKFQSSSSLMRCLPNLNLVHTTSPNSDWYNTKEQWSGGAIKLFSRQSWPDPHQFANKAVGAGKVPHNINCCAVGDERLLFTEYMPNDNLWKYVFHCFSFFFFWFRSVLPRRSTVWVRIALYFIFY